MLDGHPKLEASARCRQPAHIIGLFRIEDSWGDPQDRSRELVENLRQQRSEAGKMATEDSWRHVAWLR